MSFVVSAAVDAVGHVGNALALSKRSGMSTAMLRARDADLRMRLWLGCESPIANEGPKA
jgi:hypothetical protein